MTCDQARGRLALCPRGHVVLLGLAVLLAAARASHPESTWDDRIDEACCAYPEHDPRDYNWPYSHFQYSEVIPHVMGSFVPMTDVNVTYGEHAIVEYGKRLSPAEVARPPAVAFHLDPDRDAQTLHTLMLVDPDAPFRDRPEQGQWLHWLVYDIPGNETAAGKTLVEYAPPKPQPCAASEPLCLPEHRLTFILWEQPYGPLDLHDEDVRIAAGASKGRARYKARDFAARHRLGMHIGMNFFETWHDPGDGSFYNVPWWYVRDAASLAKLSHLVPHVERAGGPQPGDPHGKGASASDAASSDAAISRSEQAVCGRGNSKLKLGAPSKDEL